MVDINDYREEKSCIYKDEEYLVRDNGAVLRKSRPNKKARKLDDEWTWGRLNKKGYLEITSSAQVHRIVALAFLGEPPTKEHVVYHIDTNKQNNKPSNLRWITRLDQIVLNEGTRRKFEYLVGVSVYEFLSNPSTYRDSFDDSSFNWIKSVTEDETRKCLENIKCWNKSNPKVIRSERNSSIFDSLTPIAKQRDWGTPSVFACCPTEIDSDPIQCYLKNLSKDAIFAENQYGKSTVVKYATIDNTAIVIITTIPSSVKSFGLAKVTFEKGYFLHTNLGSFFTEEGAEKEFTLAQGLAWTGGDTFDDFC